MKPRTSVPEPDDKKTGRQPARETSSAMPRVSTADQDVAAQEDRLRHAGAIRVFVDVISGRQFERPGLSELIDHARAGDSLCVTRLDRLGRSLKEPARNGREPQGARYSPGQPRGAHRHDLGRRRAGVPCLRGDCPLRAPTHFRAYAGTGLQQPENAAGDPAARHWTGKPSRPRKPLSRVG